MRQFRTAAVPPGRSSKIRQRPSPRRIWLNVAVEQSEQILGALTRVAAQQLNEGRKQLTNEKWKDAISPQWCVTVAKTGSLR